MKYYGDLSKMKVQHENPVNYTLVLHDGEINMNELIGKKIKINFTGIIHCVSCGKVTKKAFGQGFCYPCFINSPMNSECILRPELCEAHEGRGRDIVWEELNHNKPHVVYLALTSGVKVGVTRNDQVPVRWIDQGAWKAIKIAETPYRQIAGLIELNLKNHLADKTPWQKMLKNEINDQIDLHSEKDRVIRLLSLAYLEYTLRENQKIYEFNYPVLKYPSKINSISPLKNSQIEATLTGIRGQYLMFDYTNVINLRSHSGYEIELHIP